MRHREPSVPGEEGPPRDLDDMLMRLKRRMADFEPDRWKSCDNRLCRRERRCADEAMRCIVQKPDAPATPEEDAALRAELLQAIRERQGRFDPPDGDDRPRKPRDMA